MQTRPAREAREPTGFARFVGKERHEVKKIMFIIGFLLFFFRGPITGIYLDQTAVWQQYRPENKKGHMRLEAPCSLESLDEHMPGEMKTPEAKKVIHWVEFRGCEYLDFAVVLGSYRFRVNLPGNALKGMMDEAAKSMLQQRFGFTDQQLNVEPARVDRLSAYKASGKFEYWGRTYLVESLLIKRGKEFGMVNVLYLDERVRQRFAERVLASMTLRSESRAGEDGPGTAATEGLAASREKIENMVAEVEQAHDTAETNLKNAIARATDQQGGASPEETEEVEEGPVGGETTSPGREVAEIPVFRTVNPPDSSEIDPFQRAIKGDLEALKRYRDAGGDLNRKNSHGASPLHYAAFHAHLQTVIFLVVNGADVAASDQQGATPLHMAAYNGNWKVAMFLLKNRADPMRKNRDGYTPGALARARGHDELARKLGDRKE